MKIMNSRMKIQQFISFYFTDIAGVGPEPELKITPAWSNQIRGQIHEIHRQDDSAKGPKDLPGHQPHRIRGLRKGCRSIWRNGLNLTNSIRR